MKYETSFYQGNSYMLLGRLQSDCDYYLGYGCRHTACLWAKDEKEQIDRMVELWNHVVEKPEWLTIQQLQDYSKEMGCGFTFTVVDNVITLS